MRGVVQISRQSQNPAQAEEIEAVLSSETFTGSPNLARLLKYLCSNHFSEHKNSLNEYRIGVEALGRPSDFDPAKNSSVRVEVHRLRGRLRKYYETEGASHPLRIILDEGHYGLQFVRREDDLLAASSRPQGFASPGEEPEEAPIGNGHPSEGWRRWKRRRECERPPNLGHDARIRGYRRGHRRGGAGFSLAVDRRAVAGKTCPHPGFAAGIGGRGLCRRAGRERIGADFGRLSEREVHRPRWKSLGAAIATSPAERQRS